MSDKNLRAGLIRLAHAKPDLRAELLPLLTTSTSTSTSPRQAAATSFSATVPLLKALHEKLSEDLPHEIQKKIGDAADADMQRLQKQRDELGTKMDALRSDPSKKSALAKLEKEAVTLDKDLDTLFDLRGEARKGTMAALKPLAAARDSIAGWLTVLK